MSVALKLLTTAPDIETARAPYKLSENELRLRSEFIAAFNHSRARGWELHIAVWNLTDELKMVGESPEAVIKRIKYVAAIPISFHYRVGYEEGHDRLKAVVTTAVTLAIARYFADAGG
jgi:hypothetical protein